MSEPNYHATKFCTKNLLTIEMRKTQILMDKPIYLGFSILDLSKNVWVLIWPCKTPKYDQKAKLCYMETGISLFTWKQMLFIKTLQKRFETGFDASRYELNKTLPKGKNKKVIGVTKEEFVGLRTKTYNYFIKITKIKKMQKTQKSVPKKQNVNLTEAA